MDFYKLWDGMVVLWDSRRFYFDLKGKRVLCGCCVCVCVCVCVCKKDIETEKEIELTVNKPELCLPSDVWLVPHVEIIVFSYTCG